MDGPPDTAQGQGGRQVRTAKGTGQIFDHHMIEYTYPNGVRMISQCRHIPGCWSSVDEYAHGSKGWCHIGAGKVYDRQGKVIWQAPKNENGHAKEHVDLFASIRKGVIPNEGEYGATSTMTSIMGRLATYTGRLVKWQDCLNSKISLANTDVLESFASEAPIQPDENGMYWVPTPGKDTDLVL
jgi:hypothetical protein